MAKKVLSIVIGAEITKVCEVSYKKNNKNKGIRVYKSISFPTPQNMIEDGYIRDKGAFAQHLRIQLKQADIRSRSVIFSIASSKIANREVIIPLVKENRIADIIKTGASEYFPVDMNDYILSHIILEKKTSDRKEKQEAKLLAKREAQEAKKQAKLEKQAIKKNSHKGVSGEIKAIPITKLKFAEEEAQPQNPAVASKDDTYQKENNINKGSKDNKSKKHIRLSVYAVPANLVKNYYNFADIMGLELISIDYSGNSSYQMLKRQAHEGVNVFIQLNEQDTVISILRDNVMVLQRTIGYGISSLVETVLEQSCLKASDAKSAIELLASRNLLEWKEPEPTRVNATPILSEAAVALEPSDESHGTRVMDEEYLAKRNIVESLVFLINSVTRMLDYYKNGNRNVEFKTIYLSGMGIRVQGIEQLFTQRIGIENKKLQKLNLVSASKKAKEFRQNPSEFMACVGSVIKPVNFVPNELVELRLRVRSIAAAIFLILLSIGGSSVLCYVSFVDYRAAKSNYEAVADKLAKMPDLSNIKNEHQTVSQQLADLQTMEKSSHQNEQIKEVLSGLQSNMLSNSCIQNIQFTDSGVVMSVLLSDNNYGANALVAKLLSQLKNIKLFSDVQDSNLVIGEDGQISLTVSCTYQ